MLSILAGAKYGACRWCTVYAVGRPPVEGDEENGDPKRQWARALQTVERHLLQKKAGNPKLKAVMNISCGFTNSGDRHKHLRDVARASIIVVGAAGDDSVSWVSESMTAHQSIH